MREINYNDLKDATVLRGKLEKWYGKPFWEKAIISLFVRIMVGQGKNGKEYRIAQIVQIVPSVSTYKLGKKECNQLLTLKIANKTKNFEMRYVSNDPVTEGEYDMWLKFLKKCNEEIPTVEDFERLKQKIYDADHYTYTEEDVEKEVRRNRENSLIPVNITKEKMRISQLISLELASGDKSKIASLEAQLKELNEKELEMEKLKRTGRKSFEKEKKVDQEEKAHKNKQKFSSTPKAKAETFDPYARRTTKVSVSWITAQKKEPAPTVEGGPVVSESDKSNVKEKAPKPKNVSKKILDMDLDISQLSSKVPVPFQKPQVTATALDSSVSEANTLSLTDFLKKKSLN
uniref:Plus3 domain-containing protein n=1 Tax=Arcella intermedia TaxID=1963864 RepID=A0A6B2L890_9EUKA